MTGAPSVDPHCGSQMATPRPGFGENVPRAQKMNRKPITCGKKVTGSVPHRGESI
jgi:hypothetical protein